MFGGIGPPRRFIGGIDLENKGCVQNPSIYSNAHFSKEEIADLRDDAAIRNEGWSAVNMTDVIENANKLSAGDRAELVAYIKASPQRSVEPPPRKR